MHDSIASKCSCNAMHGHITGTTSTLEHMERELLDGVRRIEALCAAKARRT